MMNAKQALFKCQALVPSINLEVASVEECLVTLRRVDIKEWRKVFNASVTHLERLQEHLDVFPDVEPFFEISSIVEDIQALVHSLFIFYECLQREEGDSDA